MIIEKEAHYKWLLQNLSKDLKSTISRVIQSSYFKKVRTSLLGKTFGIYQTDFYITTLVVFRG